MKEREDRHVAVVEKHTLDGVSTIALMKHKHIQLYAGKGHTHGWRHHGCYDIVLQ